RRISPPWQPWRRRSSSGPPPPAKARRDPLAQHVLLDLAARRRRQGVDQLEPLGELPPRQLQYLEEAHQLGKCRRIPFVGRDHEGARTLPEEGVRHRHEGNAPHLRVLEEEV